MAMVLNAKATATRNCSPDSVSSSVDSCFDQEVITGCSTVATNDLNGNNNLNPNFRISLKAPGTTKPKTSPHCATTAQHCRLLVDLEKRLLLSTEGHNNDNNVNLHSQNSSSSSNSLDGTYSGETSNGQPEGNGRKTYNDGSVYTGEQNENK